MMADQDNRLCANPLSCRDYQQSYNENLNTCKTCDGDIRTHRLVSETIDTVLKPVIDKVRQAPPEQTQAAFVQAACDIRVRLAGKGHDVSPAEIGMAMGMRLMQRVATLEAIVRMQQRQ